MVSICLMNVSRFETIDNFRLIFTQTHFCILKVACVQYFKETSFDMAPSQPFILHAHFSANECEILPQKAMGLKQTMAAKKKKNSKKFYTCCCLSDTEFSTKNL